MNPRDGAIREWILGCSRDGHGVETMLEMMLKAGYTEHQARHLLATTLKRPASELPVGTTQPGGRRTRHPQPPHVTADGRQMAISICVDTPVVRVIESILDAEECDTLIEQARPRLKRSRTVADGGTDEVNAARTSSGMFFASGETELISHIEARIAAMLDLPVEYGEGLQVLHYEPGQAYAPHYDWFDRSQPGYNELIERGGERVATLILYLNTPADGGGTRFPHAGLTVCARRGTGLYFAYENGDESALHAGAPVIEGEKWIATKWLRERPYR